MKFHSTISSFLITLCLFILAGCETHGPLSKGEQAVADSQASLSETIDSSIETFHSLNLTPKKTATLKPQVSSTVSLAGKSELAVTSLNLTVDGLLALLEDAVSDPNVATVQLSSQLVSIGETTQTDSDLNQSQIRFAFFQMGYSLLNLQCINQVNTEGYSAPRKAGCDVISDIGVILGGFDILVLSTNRVIQAYSDYQTSLSEFSGSIQDVIATLRQSETAPSTQLIELSKSASLTVDKATFRQRLDDSAAASVVRSSGDAASALSQAASTVASAMGMSNGSAAATALGTIGDQMATSGGALTEVGSTVSGIAGDCGYPCDQHGALTQAGSAVIAELQKTSNSNQALLEATKKMQETQMSFNLHYLQLQTARQNENRQFTMVKNLMKTKHDTVKNSINNIR